MDKHTAWLSELSDNALSEEIAKARMLMADVRRRNNRLGVRPNLTAERVANSRMTSAEAEQRKRERGMK